MNGSRRFERSWRFNLQVLGGLNLLFFMLKLHRWSHITSRKTRIFLSVFKFGLPPHFIAVYNFFFFSLEILLVSHLQLILNGYYPILYATLTVVRFS
jgi:hypothetical protein